MTSASQFISIACIHAGVYLSLGSTNIITNNTEILITSIGEGAPDGFPLLTCHTDQVACCRTSDTMAMENPIGDWHFPNGIPILVGNKAPPNASFYIKRNMQVVRLHRRESINPSSPTGTYCCTIPTNAGEITLCAKLGEWASQYWVHKISMWSTQWSIKYSHKFPRSYFNAVVCLSLLPLTNGMISYSDPTLGMGSVATYSCGPGYMINDDNDSSRTCGDDGEWSPSSQPNCVGECLFYIRYVLYSAKFSRGSIFVDFVR